MKNNNNLEGKKRKKKKARERKVFDRANENSNGGTGKTWDRFFFFFSRGETAAVARWRVSSDGALVFRSRERWRTAASMHASTNTAEDNTAGIGEGTGRGGRGCEGQKERERDRY